MPALWNFQKSWLETLPLRQKIHHFFFSHTWCTRFKYLPEGCPYMLMYSALHIMQWFSQLLDVFTPKIRRKIFDYTFLWIKTNVAYTRLEVIATQRSALQVEIITGVKLICYFVLYYCFLHWSHLPNMAVGDLAFYTLYLWFSNGGKMRARVKIKKKKVDKGMVDLTSLKDLNAGQLILYSYLYYWYSSTAYSRNIKKLCVIVLENNNKNKMLLLIQINLSLCL